MSQKIDERKMSRLNETRNVMELTKRKSECKTMKQRINK